MQSLIQLSSPDDLLSLPDSPFEKNLLRSPPSQGREYPLKPCEQEPQQRAVQDISSIDQNGIRDTSYDLRAMSHQPDQAPHTTSGCSDGNQMFNHNANPEAFQNLQVASNAHKQPLTFRTNCSGCATGAIEPDATMQYGQTVQSVAAGNAAAGVLLGDLDDSEDHLQQMMARPFMGIFNRDDPTPGLAQLRHHPLGAAQHQPPPEQLLVQHGAALMPPVRNLSLDSLEQLLEALEEEEEGEQPPQPQPPQPQPPQPPPQQQQQQQGLFAMPGLLSMALQQVVAPAATISRGLSFPPAASFYHGPVPQQLLMQVPLIPTTQQQCAVLTPDMLQLLQQQVQLLQQQRVLVQPQAPQVQQVQQVQQVVAQQQQQQQLARHLDAHGSHELPVVGCLRSTIPSLLLMCPAGRQLRPYPSVASRCKESCEELLRLVLGSLGSAGSLPWPRKDDYTHGRRSPFKYLARLCTKLKGEVVSVQQVMSCIRLVGQGRKYELIGESAGLLSCHGCLAAVMLCGGGGVGVGGGQCWCWC
jgi:hypothetical protein